LCALRVNDLIRKYEEVIKSSKPITGMVVVRRQRREETGRVVLDNPETGNDYVNIAPIRKFVEKGVTELEYPEAVGIYLFNNSIFDYLHDTSEKMRGTFNLSHDILADITPGKLYSYDIDNNTEWIGVDSPSHADRNKEIITKILLQMEDTDTHNGA